MITGERGIKKASLKL